MRIQLMLLSLLGVAFATPLMAEDIPAEAQRHLNRGIAAVELAASTADFEDALAEFKVATELAPNWAIPYYNLASVSTKLERYQDAINYYKKYLALAPDAKDADKIRMDIDKLEYKQEKRAKVDDLAGDWLCECLDDNLNRVEVPFNITITGGTEFCAKAFGFYPADVKVMQHLIGAVVPFEHRGKGPAEVNFKGRLQGGEMKGVFVREAYKEKKSGCQVPQAASEFTGKVTTDSATAKTVISLTYTRRIFQIDFTDIFFGVKPCTGVNMIGTTTDTIILYRAKKT